MVRISLVLIPQENLRHLIFSVWSQITIQSLFQFILILSHNSSVCLSLSLSLPLSLLCGTQQLSFINCPLLPPAGHSVITEDELSPDIPAAVEIFGTTFSTIQK